MEDIRAVFGDELLNYLFARDMGGVDEQRLGADQRGFVATLRQLVEQVAGRPAEVRRMDVADALLAYVPEAATSVANAARLAGGGQVPEPRGTGDDALDLLLRIGRDIYPGFLLPRAGDQMDAMLLSISGPVFRHPQIDNLCRSIYADEALKRLFPGDYPDLDVSAELGLIGLQSEIVYSSGRSASLQLIGLVNCLLTNAYYRVLLVGRLSMEAYFTAIKALLGEVRKLAVGQSCDIPVIFGFSNVELPPDTVVPVPWGTLYSPSRLDKALLPGAANVTAVLVTKRPLKILQVDRFDSAAVAQHPFRNLERYRQQMAVAAAEIERPANLTQFAFLLASPDEGFFAVQQVSRTMLDPLSMYRRCNGALCSHSGLSP
jgi:hypothetical protein